ncbi:Transcriptional regulator, GntR family domain / Aspartate aminotransferase [Fimbriiglobus ruber]|uniref:Transcriptional regulator, GntR family domain / Aspartate aminotransferase n=1 Tax=Fimbriiglobus ruber TaxID=1908690 RepID=A0A225DFP7_9BACT|nr:Transcriptional regulator, GntR family domain / Aspartate aminotransferase [Fimbriiglobus ruber]
MDTLVLDPDTATPIYRQLQDQLRRAILDGLLRPGERVPSTRRLAGTLGIGRITVAAAYEQLAAEGYLAAAVGSGTRVSQILPERLLNAPRPRPAAVPVADRRSGLSARGKTIATYARWPNLDGGRPPRPFRPHLPALDAFPRDVWERLTTRRQRRLPRDLMHRDDPLGYRPLREAIAGYLGASRGVRCTPDEVVVTAGAQQGIDLIARLLLDPGDAVWLEEPGYLPAKPVFEMAGVEVVPVPVDADGLDVAAGQRLRPKARLAYVTPSCQWPLGVTMTLSRRLELLAWADRVGGWVLEDDYAGEFRYAGRPLPALQGLDRNGRVVYMGTFSKVLFPALRLGYLVVPADLTPAFLAARWLTDRHSPPLIQAVLADFIDGGHFSRHLRRMRTLYAERQAVVVAAAKAELAGAIDLSPADVGMHLVARLVDSAEESVMDAAVAAGIESHALSGYKATPGPDSRRILGYAAYPPKAARQAMKAWGRALQEGQ